MVLDNIYRGPVLRIALGTIVLVILLLAVNYGAAANPSPISQANNSSSETGITYTQTVPFATESIKDIIVRESKKQTPVQKQQVIPFHKAPPPKKVPGTAAPLKPQSAAQNQLTSSLAPVLGSNFLGITSVGLLIPPDTMGAAGPSHVMEITNENLSFFNKSTGALISSVSLQAFWASLGTCSPITCIFDPKVFYDQNSNRFIAATMRKTTSPQSSWLMIAVSNTSDPAGNWTKWAIDADNNSGNWADFPGLGVDANNIYVTANMWSFSDVYQYSKVWVISKTQLLIGSSTITWTEFSNPTGSAPTMQPAYEFGSSSTEYLINEGYNSSNNLLNINSITFPGGTPTWTNLGFIQVNPYNDPWSLGAVAPQKGTSTPIATNDASLLNAVFRNGYLWTTHHVSNISKSNGQTEVVWYQINPANASPSSPGAPVQQGRISDTSRWYYFPSIAVNSKGEVGIGFSGSSTSEYAGAYYTARDASDAPGTMQSVALLKAGLATYTINPSNPRWGDYSATVVDPNDDTTFWTVQEYVNTSSLWGTWWGKFSIISTGIPAITSFAPSSPVNDFVGASRTFNITVNQTVNVAWYINSTQLQYNTSATEAIYINNSAALGVWNITAIANNTNGTASQQWIWNVTAAPTNYNLSGYITDKSSGLPLSGALVETNTSLFKYTDATGFYNFTLGNGTYIVNASLAGYVTNSTTVTINGADVTNANISITPAVTTNLTVFVRGTDDSVWCRTWNGSGWSGWQSLGGVIASDPSSVSLTNETYVFVRGADNGVWIQKWNGSGWSGWQSLGGNVTSEEIAATSLGSNITIFVRGADNGVWTQKWDSNVWSGWQSLGGIVASDISATSSGSNITIFARGADNGVWTQKWNGSAWSGWQGLGGVIVSDPDSVSSADATYVFVRGGDNGVWTRNWNSSGWSGWQSLGGNVTSNISSSSDAGNITIFARGIDNGVWTQNWNGAVWSGWQSLGGDIASDPDSISVASGTYVFVRATDNGVWTQNWNGTIWSGWQGLGGLTKGAPEVTSG